MRDARIVSSGEIKGITAGERSVNSFSKNNLQGPLHGWGKGLASSNVYFFAALTHSCSEVEVPPNQYGAGAESVHVGADDVVDTCVTDLRALNDFSSSQQSTDHPKVRLLMRLSLPALRRGAS